MRYHCPRILVLPRIAGSIRATKLKILAIIRHHELSGIVPYGYSIWLTMKDTFHLYLQKEDLRNVYRHLKELNKLGYIDRGETQFTKGAPGRRPYILTEEGRTLEDRFSKYLEILGCMRKLASAQKKEGL